MDLPKFVLILVLNGTEHKIFFYGVSAYLNIVLKGEIVLLVLLNHFSYWETQECYAVEVAAPSISSPFRTEQNGEFTETPRCFFLCVPCVHPTN